MGMLLFSLRAINLFLLRFPSSAPEAWTFPTCRRRWKQIQNDSKPSTNNYDDRVAVADGTMVDRSERESVSVEAWMPQSALPSGGPEVPALFCHCLNPESKSPRLFPVVLVFVGGRWRVILR